MDMRQVRSNARRMRSAIQRVEQQPYDLAPGRRPPRLPGDDLALALTTSAITARSGAAPGTGSAKLQKFDGSALADLDGTTITVRNFSSATAGIATGKYCTLVNQWGAWWVVSVEC